MTARRAHPHPIHRIGLLMQSLRTGGLEALVVRLAQAYQTQGYSAEVFAYEEGELREPLEMSGIPVHCIPKPPGYKPSFSWKLAQLFHKRRLDLVHTHHFGPLLYAAPATLFHSIPLIHTVHSNEHLGQNAHRAKLLFGTFSRFCDRITTVNEELTDFLKNTCEIQPDKVLSIRNGVDADCFHGRYSMNSLREELALPQQAWIVGSVARLEQEKGHIHLINAIPQCDPSMHFVLVGQGRELSGLKERVRELGLEQRVHFLGNRSDIPEILSLFDVFTLPSLREGLPLAMLEAMSSHLPVVGTHVGGVPSLLHQSQGGLCVEPASPTALARALSELHSHPEQCRQMADSGQRWIQKHYSQRAMVERYLCVYQQAKPVSWIQGSTQASTEVISRVWRQKIRRASSF